MKPWNQHQGRNTQTYCIRDEHLALMGTSMQMSIHAGLVRESVPEGVPLKWTAAEKASLSARSEERVSPLILSCPQRTGRSAGGWEERLERLKVRQKSM